MIIYGSSHLLIDIISGVSWQVLSGHLWFQPQLKRTIPCKCRISLSWQHVASNMCPESFGFFFFTSPSGASLMVVFSPLTSSGPSCKLFRWQNQAFLPSGVITFHSYFGLSIFPVSLSLVPHSHHWIIFQIVGAQVLLSDDKQTWFLLLRKCHLKLLLNILCISAFSNF